MKKNYIYYFLVSILFINCSLDNVYHEQIILDSITGFGYCVEVTAFKYEYIGNYKPIEFKGFDKYNLVPGGCPVDNRLPGSCYEPVEEDHSYDNKIGFIYWYFYEESTPLDTAIDHCINTNNIWLYE